MGFENIVKLFLPKTKEDLQRAIKKLDGAIAFNTGESTLERESAQAEYHKGRTDLYYEGLNRVVLFSEAIGRLEAKKRRLERSLRAKEARSAA